LHVHDLSRTHPLDFGSSQRLSCMRIGTIDTMQIAKAVTSLPAG
jgi:hypothetical protein